MSVPTLQSTKQKSIATDEQEMIMTRQMGVSTVEAKRVH